MVFKLSMQNKIFKPSQIRYPQMSDQSWKIKSSKIRSVRTVHVPYRKKQPLDESCRGPASTTAAVSVMLLV